MVGTAYERRIYAFRFATTEVQDDAFITRMNAAANRPHFNIVFRNCANFADEVLDFYFPRTFGRRILPVGGIVTPRQVAYELEHYARKHPEIQLTVVGIPLVPGYRRPGRVERDISGSLSVAGYGIPIAILSPYAGGAVIADYLALGRYPLPLKQAKVLEPRNIALLASSERISQSMADPGNQPQIAATK